MAWQFLGLAAALTAIIAARYLALSGLFYWLLWQRGGEKLRAKRLNRDRPMRGIVMKEIRLSLLSSAVYAAPAAFALTVFLNGGTAIYTDWRAYGGVPYLFLSFFIYLVVQDTYYYFAHRLMHHPRLFRWTHAGHHRSRQPTPFASFAFDPAEAALTAWLMPAMVFVVPIHVGVLIGLLMFMSFVAVWNHSGWEVLPRFLVRGPVGGQLISATHHSYHHIRFDRNYGLYFRFWDKVMGTDTMPDEARDGSRLSMRPERA
ncbi:sterol desaturase family protein [Rhodomicrobium vannielii ATCC 17100]|uniref:sterol desaturase family protein n=1 Tax=Rhodomicrobium vannielii TaxID=1069 RepID=UPI0019188B30|nr:sterol desaturase family protein [Rhodomicrobium vannielii]MBJ7535346.1 sterol desaturase family protein [Rhodomicrobium vannielii ATCC 17100]